MERCKRLRAARKNLGLTQREFAELIGLSNFTIFKLEKDETAWAVMQDTTVDKIEAFYDLYTTGELTNSKPICEEPKKLEEPTVIAMPEPVVEVETKNVSDDLTQLDEKTLTLIEFTYENLKEAKSHEEFVANISLLKRILAKY